MLTSCTRPSAAPAPEEVLRAGFAAGRDLKLDQWLQDILVVWANGNIDFVAWPGVVYTCNLSPQVAEAGGSLQV